MYNHIWGGVNYFNCTKTRTRSVYQTRNLPQIVYMLIVLQLKRWKSIDEYGDPAPNDTAYKRWCCHSELKLLCKLCRTSRPPAMGARFTVFWACRPCRPAGWLALLLTKAGDVETNPGPTTLNKKVWICDICHKQIHVRKQISIRCNRIEHWVQQD